MLAVFIHSIHCKKKKQKSSQLNSQALVRWCCRDLHGRQRNSAYRVLKCDRFPFLFLLPYASLPIPLPPRNNPLLIHYANLSSFCTVVVGFWFCFWYWTRYLQTSARDNAEQSETDGIFVEDSCVCSGPGTLHLIYTWRQVHKAAAVLATRLLCSGEKGVFKIGS